MHALAYRVLCPDRELADALSDLCMHFVQVLMLDGEQRSRRAGVKAGRMTRSDDVAATADETLEVAEVQAEVQAEVELEAHTLDAVEQQRQ